MYRNMIAAPTAVPVAATLAVPLAAAPAHADECFLPDHHWDASRATAHRIATGRPRIPNLGLCVAGTTTTLKHDRTGNPMYRTMIAALAAVPVWPRLWPLATRPHKATLGPRRLS